MTISYGSICTGYDGIGMGLGLAGLDFRHAWMSENEASVAEVLKLEHPDTPNLGDIKTADWSEVGHTDLMSSGDPCQSISIAGRQEGRDDPRFLWPWVREAYRAAEPDRILFENVANMVSHDGGRTLAERFEHLREDGYAVRWTVIGACAVGAPHHRHRWYALAEFVGGDVPEAVRVGGKTAICGAPIRGARRVLPTPNARDGGTRGTPTKEHAARRAADPMRSLNLEDATVLLPTPRATDIGTPGRRSSEGWRPLDRAAVASLPDPETWGKYAETVALWESVTGIPAPEPTEVGPKGGRRLNPALSEWMMGLRPGLLTGRMSRNDALKAAGNGVVPLQAAAAWNLLTS
jgi:DNA (cytosine-5)-methyltransferase 1